MKLDLGSLPVDTELPHLKTNLSTERPSSLEVNRKKRLTVTEELLTVAVDDDQHSISSLSQHSDDDDDDAQMLSHDEFTDMLTPDDIDTPDELEESIMERKLYRFKADVSLRLSQLFLFIIIFLSKITCS